MDNMYSGEQYILDVSVKWNLDFILLPVPLPSENIDTADLDV